MPTFFKARSCALAYTAAVMLATSAFADSGKIDLSGKTVEWLNPFEDGGGASQWANFYAPLLTEALPGHPNVVATFMPGAGSTRGANHFQGLTYEDGTQLFGTSGSTHFPYLLNDPRVRYEFADWHPVLASGTNAVVYIKPDMAERLQSDHSAAPLSDEIFIIGSQGAARLDLVPLLALEMLGLQGEPVFGIEGRGAGRLMFERGEANIDWQTTPSYLANVQQLVDAGTAAPWFTFGTLDDQGNIVRDPNFADLPTFKEVCEATESCPTSGPIWDAWKAFFVAGFPAQKILFLPKEAPEEAIETYTRAFEDIKARPDFAEISSERLGIYPQMTGAAARRALQDATVVSEDARTYVLDWLLDRYGVSLN